MVFLDKSYLFLEIMSLFLFLIAASVNHIDDTDETYGYWEPLHYLLFNKGMQTWEYSPKYSIRTYAFVYPFYLLANIISIILPNRIALFYAIRSIIGIFTSFAISKFVFTINKTFGENIALTTYFLIIFSPGVFYSSTSFLPSAVSMSLIMLSFSYWNENKNLKSIFWGSVAVLWTGWPFVGLLLLFIGIDMLSRTFYGNSFTEKFASSFLFVFQGLLVVFLVQIPVLMIDKIYFNKWLLF